MVSETNGRWGHAIEIPGLAALNKGGDVENVSASCGPAGNCAAGGSYVGRNGLGQGFVISQTSGRWGHAIEIPGLAALNKGGDVEHVSVSCSPRAHLRGRRAVLRPQPHQPGIRDQPDLNPPPAPPRSRQTAWPRPAPAVSRSPRRATSSGALRPPRQASHPSPPYRCSQLTGSLRAGWVPGRRTPNWMICVRTSHNQAHVRQYRVGDPGGEVDMRGRSRRSSVLDLRSCCRWCCSQGMRWREDAIDEFLDIEDARVLFVAGCRVNKVVFHPRFDVIIC